MRAPRPASRASRPAGRSERASADTPRRAGAVTNATAARQANGPVSGGRLPAPRDEDDRGEHGRGHERDPGHRVEQVVRLPGRVAVGPVERASATGWRRRCRRTATGWSTMFSTASRSIRSFCSASVRPRRLAKNGRCGASRGIGEDVVGLPPVPCVARVGRGHPVEGQRARVPPYERAVGLRVRVREPGQAEHEGGCRDRHDAGRDRGRGAATHHTDTADEHRREHPAVRDAGQGEPGERRRRRARSSTACGFARCRASPSIAAADAEDREWLAVDVRQQRPERRVEADRVGRDERDARPPAVAGEHVEERASRAKRKTGPESRIDLDRRRRARRAASGRAAAPGRTRGPGSRDRRRGARRRRP